MRLKAGLMSFRHAGLRKAFNTWQVWAALVKEVAHDDTFVRYKPTWETSTKVEPKPLTPTELGLPEPANDIQRYIVGSMAAMANAQRESATRK